MPSGIGCDGRREAAVGRSRRVPHAPASRVGTVDGSDPRGRAEAHRLDDSERHRAPVHDRSRRPRGRARRLVRLASRVASRGQRSETSRPRASNASRTCGPTSSSSGSTCPTRAASSRELFRLRVVTPGTESREEVLDGMAEGGRRLRRPEAGTGRRRCADGGPRAREGAVSGKDEAARPAGARPRTGVLRARKDVVPPGAVRHLQPRKRRGRALRRKLARGLDRAGPRLESRGDPRSQPGRGAERGARSRKRTRSGASTGRSRR